MFYEDINSKGSYTKPEISYFTLDRKNPKNDTLLREYEISEINPPYLQDNKENHAIMKFISGIISGFLETGGFNCEVHPELSKEKNKIKSSFIIMFTPKVLNLE